MGLRDSLRTTGSLSPASQNGSRWRGGQALDDSDSLTLRSG